MKVSYTIATANYLAQAKVAGQSLLEHNPDYQFFIFLLDKVDGQFDVSYFQPIEIIEIADAGIPELPGMLERYSLFELSNALKPFVAEYLFNTLDIDSLVYIDSDIWVFAPFKEVNRLQIDFCILLTSHLHSPLPQDGCLLDEKAFLNAGIYNGGFFALKRSQSTFEFLAWWKSRLITECKVDFSKGLFVDQLWLNFVPLFFTGVKIIEHPGYNLAYWNFHERSLSVNDGRYIINEVDELVFFHFSGYDFLRPDTISIHQTRYDFNNRPEFRLLFSVYKERIFASNFEFFSGIKPYYRGHKILPAKPGYLRRLRFKVIELLGGRYS